VKPGGGQPWSVQFRREREAIWRELERLVAQAEAGTLYRLGAEKFARLPRLYRATVSSLSVARASVLDQGLLAYLEALTARAYLVVYAPKRTLAQTLLPFLWGGFPAAVRSIAWHVVIAAALLGLGFALAFAMVRTDLEHYYLFADASMAQGRDPLASVEDLRATLFHEHGERGLLDFAVLLFAHNSSVGILAFGLGFLFGLPVVLLLLHNGMLLGAMTALFHERGLAVEWWSWILPHGVVELTAIVLCGAAGLAVGQRVVFAGRHGRRHELALVGRRMGAVVAGAVLMLLLAAFLEGVFRQVVHDLGRRYGCAIGFAVAWAVYFVRAGRGALP
jgi:uncharacterized membrane protein SpoIIM required for sporulation